MYRDKLSTMSEQAMKTYGTKVSPFLVKLNTFVKFYGQAHYDLLQLCDQHVFQNDDSWVINNVALNVE